MSGEERVSEDPGKDAEDLRFEVTQQGSLRSYSLEDDLAYLLVTLHPQFGPAEPQPPVETIFLLDCGGLMSAADQRTRQLTALAHFFHGLRDEDSAAVILFAAGSTLVSPLQKGAALRGSAGRALLTQIAGTEMRVSRERRMAPALVRALEHFASRGVPGSVRRICCLTDRVADDADECAMLLEEHRTHLAIYLYGFVMKLDPSRVTKLLANSPFGVAEHLPYDLDIESTFTRLSSDLNKREHTVKLAVYLAQDVIGGSLFQYDPSEGVLGSMDASQPRWHDLVGPHSAYSFLFEARLPAVVAEGRTRIGTLSLWHRSGERGPMRCQEIELTVERTKAPGSPDKDVCMKRDLLLAIRDGDTSAQIAMYEAQLDLYRREHRDPSLIAAIEQKLRSLLDPAASPEPDDAEAAYLESHPTSSTRARRPHRHEPSTRDDSLTGWDAKSAVESSLNLAVEYAHHMQDQRGAWSGEPDPRLFDTSLVAYALSHVESQEAAAAVERAFSWMTRQTPQDHDPIALLLDATPRGLLSGDLDTVELRGPTLYSNRYRRKTLLLYALALHAKIPVLSPYTPEQIKGQVKRFFERVDQIRTREWGRVDLISVYSILEALDGNLPAARMASERLVQLQSANGAFGHNPVTTAIAFLALSLSMPETEPWRRCLEHLLTTQKRDGTWRFCACDVRDTALMLRVFGDHPDFAKRAAPKAHRFLLEAQSRDGGWGFLPGVESDNESTACVLLALRDQEDEATLQAVDSGVEYLLSRRREDALWITWQDAADDVAEDCVAHVVAAIAAFRGTHSRSIRPAQTWLEQQYDQHGRWTASWYRNLPYSTLEVSRGLRVAHPTAYRAVQSLCALQNEDGGFPPEPGEDSSPSATGLSLAAFTDLYFLIEQPFMRRALHFLCKSQRSDGTWPGEPETYGPRPLLRHVPLSTHAFASMGLMRSWQRGMR